MIIRRVVYYVFCNEAGAMKAETLNNLGSQSQQCSCRKCLSMSKGPDIAGSQGFERVSKKKVVTAPRSRFGKRIILTEKTMFASKKIAEKRLN